MRVLFLGSGEIGVPSLRLLARAAGHDLVGVVCQPDKPAGRHKALRPAPTKIAAADFGVPVFQPPKIRVPEAVEIVRSLSPDLIVVMAYGQILPPQVLAIPTVACINLHASLLPKHRGAAPIHGAILAGDAETGVTVMYVDEGLDTGDILLAKRIAIRRRETAGSLHDRLALLAPEALAEAFGLLAEGGAGRFRQDSGAASYSPKLTHESGKIDWGQGAEQIERLIRAMNPWPSAWAMLPGKGGPKQMKVFSAILCRKAAGPAGSVIASGENGLLVGTGSCGLLLKQVQIEGGRPMDAGAFLRGHPVEAATVLG